MGQDSAANLMEILNLISVREEKSFFFAAFIVSKQLHLSGLRTGQKSLDSRSLILWKSTLVLCFQRKTVNSLQHRK